MPSLEILLPQFIFIIPKLLLFLVGAVSSLVELKRIRAPARLALVGCVLVFVVTFLSALVQGYLVAEPGRAKDLAMWMGIVGIVHVALEVIGLSLILSAVFAGRSAPAAFGDPK